MVSVAVMNGKTAAIPRRETSRWETPRRGGKRGGKSRKGRGSRGQGKGIRGSAERFRERYHLNLPDALCLSFSLIAGFLLRMTGINWGGVQSIYQPDERKLVLTVVRMAFYGNLSTNDFYYPNQFLSRLQALLLMGYRGITGRYFDGYSVEPYWICRIVTALAGVLTIFLCFLIGNYFYRHLGAVFAGLVAVSPYMVALAKQVTGDVTAACFASLAMLFALRYSEERKKRYLCWMSMGAAMATMEKWHGGFVTVFIALVVALYAPSLREFVWHGVVSLVAYFAWIFAIAPAVLLHFRTAITDGFFNIATYDNAKGPGYLRNVVFYLQGGILHCGGVLYILAILFGLFLVIRSRDKRYCILLAGAIKVAILSFLNRGFCRWELEWMLCEMFLIALSLRFLLWGRRLTGEGGLCDAKQDGAEMPMPSDPQGAGKVNGATGVGGRRGRGMPGIRRAAAAVVYFVLLLEGLGGSLLISLVAVRKEQDVRYVQEQYCQSHSITPMRTISGYYSAYAPGGIRTDVGEYQRFYRTTDAFVMRDGVPCKLADGKVYAWTTFCGEDEIKKYLDAHCPIIARFERKYLDVFGIPIEGVPYSFWDPILIRNTLHAIREVWDGAYTGQSDIVLYDIRNLEAA